MKSESCRFNIPLRPERDALLTDFGKKKLDQQYLMPGESYQDCFMRVAQAFADDHAHAERMYDYISRHWMMPATPVLANGGTKRGLPISCFLNECTDSLEGILDMWNDNAWMAANGGGIGSYWGNVRGLGEPLGRNGTSAGIIPFINVSDRLTLAISQGSLRRGSTAAYLPIHHPEIEEFIEIRKPTGGDYNRRALNIHHGVVITDAFMQAVENDELYDLMSPHTGHVIHRISARNVWCKILKTRLETGEPYLLFIDTVNRSIPKHHQKLGLNVKTSNLCSEITLPTGIDHLGNNRTAVCCLSSVNLRYFLEWEKHPTFIQDCARFLDNVLQSYIDAVHHAHQTQNKGAFFSPLSAAYSAQRERSIGLGVMGWHTFLQNLMVPMNSVMAHVWNKRIFSHIDRCMRESSHQLALERGACPDAAECGMNERFSNATTIAPTASIADICAEVSPGIESIFSNACVRKTLGGTTAFRNRALEALLEQKGCNTPEIWTSIIENGGSVQHLTCLNAHEKEVFLTAFEINQEDIVDLASERQPFISQSQSLNLFFFSNAHKKYIHRVHWRAWKKGVKSVYYARSMSGQRAETEGSARKILANETARLHQTPSSSLPLNYDECSSCQ